jgi:hypothetical protein
MKNSLKDRCIILKFNATLNDTSGFAHAPCNKTLKYICEVIKYGMILMSYKVELRQSKVEAPSCPSSCDLDVTFEFLHIPFLFLRIFDEAQII